jgi:hypothetical protein
MSTGALCLLFTARAVPVFRHGAAERESFCDFEEKFCQNQDRISVFLRPNEQTKKARELSD